MQTEINFNSMEVFIPHKKESNQESQKILDDNRIHFSKQMKILFDYLMAGGDVSSANCYQRLGFTDLRRRICDLDAIGVYLSFTMVDSRMKSWYMSNQDKENNKKFL